MICDLIGDLPITDIGNRRSACARTYFWQADKQFAE